jgi:hypothetical protein
MLWGYCEHCHLRREESLLSECDYCNDFYCSACDPCLEDIICCKKHSVILEFCSTDCMKSYVEMYWACAALQSLNIDSESE